jgi:hypothetical protein
MAAPRHGSKKTESSSNYYVVLFVKLFLIIVILLWLPSLVDGRSRTARSGIKSRRKQSVTGHVYRKRLDCEVDCMDNYPEDP